LQPEKASKTCFFFKPKHNNKILCSFYELASCLPQRTGVCHSVGAFASVCVRLLTLSTHIFCVPLIGRALDNFVRCENKPSMLRSVSAEAKSVNTRINFIKGVRRAAQPPSPFDPFFGQFDWKSRRQSKLPPMRVRLLFLTARFSWLAIAVGHRSLAPPRRKLFLAGERDCWKEGKKHLSFAQVRERVFVSWGR